jgi:hypothetical protein
VYIYHINIDASPPRDSPHLVRERAGARADVALELERVDEERDGRAPARAEQEAVHGLLLGRADAAEEARVVEVEADVVLREDVERLDDVRRDDEEAFVRLGHCLLARFEPVAERRDGPAEADEGHVGQEDEPEFEHL